MYHMRVRMKVCLKKSYKRKSVYVDVPHQTPLTEDSFPTSFHSQLPKSLPSLKGKYMHIIIRSNDKTQKLKRITKEKKLCF